jgi:tetratricopeptide (TPR) repeat protein
MNIRNIISIAGAGTIALAGIIFSAATAQGQYGGAPAPSLANGGQGGDQGAQNGQGRGRGPAIDPAEEAAVKAFNAATDPDAQITAGESFEQKYPNSRYLEGVQGILVNDYYSKQNWDKFYPEADRVLAKDPDNVPVLTLVGWVIPRVYKADDPSEPAKLDQSEKDEKHALEIIGTMPKPAGISDDQFNQAKASAAAQAHSGLGMTYFRKNDFDNSAKELQTATTETPDVDPTDLYILGIDYQKLNRNSDASAAFTKCAAIPGGMQDRCKQLAMTAGAAH